MNAPDDSDTGAAAQDQPLILGAQLAAAQAAEDRHQAARPEPRDPSPLAGITYDLPAVELGLLHFRLTGPDEQIDEFAERFASETADQRARLRSSLTIEDFYTVFRYARRAVVRALRSGDVQVASRAVSALAAVDGDRVDGRDLIWQGGLLAYAVHRVGGQVTEVFEAAAQLAGGQSQTGAALREVGGRPPGGLREWGFREVQTAEGIGLIEDDGGMFLAQTRSVRAAAIIARAAGPGSGTWFAGFGVAAGRLCAVLIARSVIAEVASVETQQSIQRFRPVLAEALTTAGADL